MGQRGTISLFGGEVGKEAGLCASLEPESILFACLSISLSQLTLGLLFGKGNILFSENILLGMGDEMLMAHFSESQETDLSTS